ncbi:MAG: double zinc ribbon domain-containing protein [Persephonella sp.]|nr:double zinc ribbon domain-containing protein [Persephonella sp.]
MNILNALFPGRCVICEKLFVFKKQNLFCEECLSKIKKEKLIYCRSCGAREVNCQRCIKNRYYNDIEIFRDNDYALNTAYILVQNKKVQKSFISYI